MRSRILAAVLGLPLVAAFALMQVPAASATTPDTSVLVNVRCIRELEPAFHGDCTVLLRDGTRLTLSRTYRAAFRRLFGGTG